MVLLKNGTYTVSFPSDTQYLPDVEKLTVTIAREANFSDSQIDDFAIAITELFNNAVHHGNKNDPKKKVTFTFHLLPEGLEISVKDQGEGFEPETIKDPLAPENLFSESGRGIFLVKHLMDKVRFNISDKGSEVIIFKSF